MFKNGKKPKPTFARAMSFVLSSLCLLSITGCGYNRGPAPIRSSGFFNYIIVGENSSRQEPDDDSLAIVGFTPSGQEQETLDIPREIDGHLVKHIGLHDESFYHYASHHVSPSDNLKKIYIFENMEDMHNFSGYNVDIVVCSETLNPFANYGSWSHKNLFLYEPLFIDLGNTNYCRPANINFMNNYPLEDNGGLYRLDNIETGENVPMPPAPILEGYDFTGWYSEAECINMWDFESIPTIEENENLTLFAGWQLL